jgi:hypothetical protein
MSQQFKVGDEITSTRHGDDPRTGRPYRGRVRRIDADGDVYVKWDGYFVEYQESPQDVEYA